MASGEPETAFRGPQDRRTQPHPARSHQAWHGAASGGPAMSATEVFNELPEFENLCLNDLSPTSRSDLQLVARGGDEELFKATAKMVVELQDYGGADPFGVTEALADESPPFVAKHGKRAIEQMAKLILASKIRSL